MSLEYWYVLPVSVLVATIAMASGIGGATFFAPFFILVLRLPPEVAIGTGLITQLFGFASGLHAYARKGTIDYRLGRALLLVAMPMALLGSWLAGWLPSPLLRTILGTGLLLLSLRILSRAWTCKGESQVQGATPSSNPGHDQTIIKAADGEELRYTVQHFNEGRVIIGVGALFLGLISSGLGELNNYYFLQRGRVPARVAVATSIFIVAFSTLAASVGHLARFWQAGPETLNQVSSLVIFTVPGVILGAQVGSRLAHRLSPAALVRGVGVLLLAAAVLTLSQGLL